MFEILRVLYDIDNNSEQLTERNCGTRKMEVASIIIASVILLIYSRLTYYPVTFNL